MAPFPTGLGWCQHTQRRKGRGRMKSAEEIMNVLEAYDLTGSYRDAAELAGCSHHTVAHYVALRAAGKLTAGQGARRPQLVDEFLPKLEELVDRSHGRIRADVAHRKLAAMGFTGCERTTRRAVAGLKAAWRVVRSQPVKPIAASFRCATSARIRPCERSTSSSSFGRNSSTSCGRRAPWPAVSFPAARSAT